MASTLPTDGVPNDSSELRNLLLTRVVIAYGYLYLIYIPYLWFASTAPFAGIGILYSTPLLIALGLGIIHQAKWAYWVLILVTAGRVIVLGYLLMTWVSKVWGIKTFLLHGFLVDFVMMFLIWTSFVFKGTVMFGRQGALVSPGFPIAASVEVFIHLAMCILWTVILLRERRA